MSNLGNLSGFINENWHGGQIDGDFFNHPEMNIEENLKVAKVKKASIWNWKHAITRELMRGHHKKDILYKYQDIINKFNLQEKIISFLNKYDGIIGYFIVDVSNFDSKFTYENIPSFMRECNLYAINSTELREIISRSLISENDGSLDGFMSANDNIQEEVHYVDEYTELPCIDNLNTDIDNEDERLDKIADLFLNKKLITMNERNKFDNVENKFNYLVSALKRSFKLKSNSGNNKIENDVSDYNLQNYNLHAETQKQVKDVDVKNLKQNKVDDIGNVAMPEKVDIKKENKKSDFKQDVKLDKKVKSEKVDKLKQNKVDDIGNVSIPKKIEIKEEKKKSDFKQDVTFDKKIKPEKIDKLKEIKIDKIKTDLPKSEKIDGLKESKIDEISINDNKKLNVENKNKKSDFISDIDLTENKYDIIDDNINELSKKDYQEDVVFDNTQNFIIEDIKDMRDDDFDYADLNNGDVNLDEMFSLESDNKQVDVDKKPEQFDIDGKSDWIIDL